MIYITEEMLSSGKPFRQGEVLIWARKYAPQSVLDGMAGLKLSPMKLENDQMILGHSETGHHHVLEPVDKAVPISQAAQALIDAANDTFVELKLLQPCALRHLRSTDTHEAAVFPAGEYIRGLREEQTPEGWQRVHD